MMTREQFDPRPSYSGGRLPQISWEAAWSHAAAARILMHPVEARRLWELAGETTGPIVEVGSATGGSALILAAHSPVTCIDPLCRETANTPLLRPIQDHIADLFHSHLAACPWGERIKVVQQYDRDVWPTWKIPIGLLFLDHEHTAAAVTASLAGWRPHLLPDGLVALHDYGNPDYPGVKIAVDASPLEIIHVVRHLAIGRFPTISTH